MSEEPKNQESMEKICDHTSVGMLVWDGDKLLLIERRKFPFGFAPPAGHVDGHGSYEDAAQEELREEVGLETQHMTLLIENRKENRCRRQDGEWHFWKIYEIEAEGAIKRSEDETKQAGFYTKTELQTLAQRTERYRRGEISEEEWEENPGLELVWYDWLKELEII